jgi:peptidyl-prolyl cis-trans isomerase B (cyclophilin B)
VRVRCGLAVAAVALAALGSTAHGQPAAEDARAVRCAHVPKPEPRPEPVTRPSLRLRPGSRATIVLRTSCGSIKIRLATARAPETTSSVAGLVRQGYYDGLPFHRVALGFVVQGGDPFGDGTGGPGYTVVERPPRGLRYTRGVVAMARSASEPAGASGSQFFIVTARDSELEPTWALLGRVVAGMETVDRIEALGPRGRHSGDGPPRRPIVIRRALLRVRSGGATCVRLRGPGRCGACSAP